MTRRLEANLPKHRAEADRPYVFSFSYGSRPFDAATGKTVEALLAEADAAMYRPKQARQAARQVQRHPVVDEIVEQRP